jgi:hypothetical protein
MGGGESAIAGGGEMKHYDGNYKVFYYGSYSNPLELQSWLEQRLEEGLELIAVIDDYFIFKVTK